MAPMILQLDLFAALLIQLTSSQDIYNNFYQHCDDVTSVSSSSSRTEQMLSEIQANITELMTAVLQLQKDVAELKDCSSKVNSTL